MWRIEGSKVSLFIKASSGTVLTYSKIPLLLLSQDVQSCHFYQSDLCKWLWFVQALITLQCTYMLNIEI